MRLVGVDVKEQSRRHNTELAEELGLADELTFVAAGIRDVDARRSGRTSYSPCTRVTPRPTTPCAGGATGRPTWCWPRRAATTTSPHSCVERRRRRGYAALTRDGILRERLADTLTDALRASILRLVGYRVDVVEFVDSKHTPRNTLLRAVRTGAEPQARPARSTTRSPPRGACVPRSPSCSTWRPAVIRRLALVGVLLARGRRTRRRGRCALPTRTAPAACSSSATTGSTSRAGWSTSVR